MDTEPSQKEIIKMQNSHLLKGCDAKVVELALELDKIARHRFKTYCIITSGKREGKGRSWHNAINGALAVDFVFFDKHVFDIVSSLKVLHGVNRGVWRDSTEFEVCAGWSKKDQRYKQHIHVAFGTEGRKEYFTGGYA